MSEKQKWFYPCCKVPNCGGILKIKINDNFTIDFKCSKDEEHTGKKIYFKTFERFYLKENKIKKCNQCNTILKITNTKYECKECEKIYCKSCFMTDIHIKKKYK